MEDFADMTKTVIQGVLVVCIAMALQACNNYVDNAGNNNVSSQQSQSATTNEQVFESKWIETKNANDFKLDELIEANKAQTITESGKVLKIQFTGYRLNNKTVLDQGKEITYTVGIEEEPYQELETYIWKDGDDFRSLRNLKSGNYDKNFYYVQSQETEQALMYVKAANEQESLGLYVNDYYEQSIQQYASGLLPDDIEMIDTVSKDDESGLYIISIKDTNDYYYDVYFDDNLLIKEVSHEFRYGQKNQIYTVEIIDTVPDLPDWVSDVIEKADISCKIKHDSGTTGFKIYQGLRVYVCAGDEYTIKQDNYINIADTGMQQNDVPDNTDIYILGKTEFSISKT